jgi:hypothetical protein
MSQLRNTVCLIKDDASYNNPLSSRYCAEYKAIAPRTPALDNFCNVAVKDLLLTIFSGYMIKSGTWCDNCGTTYSDVDKLDFALADRFGFAGRSLCQTIENGMTFFLRRGSCKHVCFHCNQVSQVWEADHPTYLRRLASAEFDQ